VLLRAVPARVTLPDPGAWRARRDGTFVVLEHRDGRSRLVLRVWRAERLVRPSMCENTARLHRPTLPQAEAGEIIERRKIDSPRDYDVHLTAGIDKARGGGVHGFALAVGATVGRCYLGLYETWADGPGAPERVAERLAIMIAGVIENVALPAPGETEGLGGGGEEEEEVGRGWPEK
jgi:hypothetical protein